MPENTSNMCPSNHHRLFVVLVKEDKDAFKFIAELALDLLIVLLAAVVINIVLAPLT
jgi:hypothetical protein